MSPILEPSDAPDPRAYGGKAAMLGRLGTVAARLGAEIPPWIAVAAPNVDSELSLPPDARDAIRRRADALAPGGLFAVRSSAVDEDGAAHSFAGQFESFLNVAVEDVPAKVEEVWRSGLSARVTSYRRDRNIAETHLPAVLVQLMVPAEAAGVAFAADPVSGRRDMAVVGAVAGLGDRLVQGDADGDTYRVAADGTVAQRHIAGTEPVLSDGDVRRIAALVRDLSTELGRPQDIEWALAGGRLYLLQARPITTLPSEDGRLLLWDNSNIVESYSGVTTPLTFSFAYDAYGEVYTQLGRILGIPERVLTDRRDVFRNMLGLIRGRVYYNLLNWYRALALLPGFGATRRYMEQMMGVDRALSDELTGEVVRERKAMRRSPFAGSLQVARVLLRMIRHRLTLAADVRAFHRHVNGVLADTADISGAPLDRLALVYRDMERRLLTRWSVPLVNDLFCMIEFGIHRRLLARWCDDADGGLQNDLLVGQGDIVSAEPARRIRAMAAQASTVPGLAETLRTAPVDAALAALRAHPPLASAYEAYLARFGDRCIGELKLESPTVADQPDMLLRGIGFAALSVGDPAASIARPDAEAEMVRRLHGHRLRRLVLRVLTAEAKARVRDRENLRFERTRVFGRVRRVFVEAGHRLTEAGVLRDPSDVFCLRVQEILGYAEGTGVGTALQEIADTRRREFDHYRASPPPPRRFATRGPVGNSRFIEIDRTSSTATADGDRRSGLGCCPGVVRGRARVVHDPHTTTLEAGDILVAEFTDPGWVPLFARCAGLLVERGSLLSHSAIVAREMNIPAVVGIAGVTSWIEDGDLVEFDGATGTVVRLPPETETMRRPA